MKSLFTVLLIASFAFTCVLADIDPCQSTLDKVKTASRLANAWRAACEDASYRGASCYNYWAQASELLDLEMNFQACAVQAKSLNSKFMLGDSTAPGIITDDATRTNGVENPAAAANTKLVNDQYNDLRTAFTNTTNNEISNVVGVVSANAVQDRTNVSAEANAQRAFVTSAQTTLRQFVDNRTADEIQADSDQSSYTRNHVSRRHQYTIAAVVNETTIDANMTAILIAQESANTRAFQIDQSTLTDTSTRSEGGSTRQVVNDQTVQTQAYVHNEMLTTQATVSSEQSNTRSFTTASGDTLNNGVRADATSATQFVQLTHSGVRQNVSATASNIRSMFSAMQTLIATQYANESLFQNSMINTTLTLMAFWDLEDGNANYRRTHWFQAPSQSSQGAIDTLRALSLDTLTYNEKTYGTNKVGYGRTYFNNGESYYRVGNYRSAAAWYRYSYTESVQTR